MVLKELKLKTYVKKTILLMITKAPNLPNNIKVGNVEIEEVNQFCYDACTLGTKGRML